MNFLLTTAGLWFLGGINVTTFLLFGYDKWMARSGARRISETFLLLLMLIGGIIGGVIGMIFFRHKTRKSSFQLKVALLGLLYAIVFGTLLYAWNDPSF